MAKDDYFVIVCKILSYLYVKLKSGEDALKDIKEITPFIQAREKRVFLMQLKNPFGQWGDIAHERYS